MALVLMFGLGISFKNAWQMINDVRFNKIDEILEGFWEPRKAQGVRV